MNLDWRIAVLGVGAVAALGCAGTANASSENAAGSAESAAGEVVAQGNGWQAVTVASGLDRPWGVAWLPDGRALVTLKGGEIVTVKDGQATPVTAEGMPRVFSGGQGGLMDVALHPDFAKNSLVYFTLSTGDQRANHTILVRGKLEGNRISGFERLFGVSELKNGGQHFGSRILWLPDGTLLMSIGDGGNPPTRLNGDFIRNLAQSRASHLGKVLRLTAEGRPAPGNPFANQSGAAPEVWSYGHRNIQGLARDPKSGRIFANEHGAKGGDELNLVAAGKNFGWPKATHSTEYWGPAISDHRSLPGMADPKVVWTPATAPSGLAFYTGSKFAAWQGQLFSGGLASRDVRRLTVDAQGNVREVERMGMNARVRDVRQGPDGFLYVLTDEGNGKLIRIEPR